jgi:hypothetical protein
MRSLALVCATAATACVLSSGAHATDCSKWSITQRFECEQADRKEETNRLAVKVACWELKIAHDRVAYLGSIEDQNDHASAERRLSECRRQFPSHIMWSTDYGFTRGN